MAGCSFASEHHACGCSFRGSARGFQPFAYLVARSRSITSDPKLYGSLGGADFLWPENDQDFVKKYPIDSPRFCIEVQNLGLNPVTVELVGFLKRRSKTFLAVNNPVIKDGGEYPRRLEPHSSFVVYTRYTPRELKKKFGAPYCAFAERGSGRKFRGTSPVLKEVADIAAD